MNAVRPLVSLIVRTKGDRPGLLDRALQSIMAQTYPNLEVIVIEDGGRLAAGHDDPDAARHRFPIRYLSIAKAGRSAAGNAGLNQAQGAFIGFLDDDDLILPLHVATLVDALLRDDRYGAAYAGAMELPDRVTDLESLVPHFVPPLPFSRLVLWQHNFLPIQTVLFQRKLFDACGGFETSLDYLEDWDLWLRYSRDHAFAMVPALTSFYRPPETAAAREARAGRHNQAIAQVRARHPSVTCAVGGAEIETILAYVRATPEAYLTAAELARALARKVRLYLRRILHLP